MINTKFNNRDAYRFLKMEHFTDEELQQRFQDIVSVGTTTTTTAASVIIGNNNNNDTSSSSSSSMTFEHLHAYMEQRIQEMEHNNNDNNIDSSSSSTDDTTQQKRQQRHEYIAIQSQQLWNFLTDSNKRDMTTSTTSTSISRTQFTQRLQDSAKAVDFARIAPLAISMLMVGSTVGVTTPAMVRTTIDSILDCCYVCRVGNE